MEARQRLWFQRRGVTKDLTEGAKAIRPFFRDDDRWAITLSETKVRHEMENTDSVLQERRRRGEGQPGTLRNRHGERFFGTCAHDGDDS